jgi:DDE family transposase
LEAEAKARADAERPQYETKKAAYEAKKGRRGQPPKPPDATPPPTRQSNRTDPDSALMRRSDAHEYRQAYNAQAVVCAEGSQLILAINLLASPADAPGFAATVLAMEKTHGLPRAVLADAGFASGLAVAELEAHGSSPWWRSPAPNRTGPTISVRRPSQSPRAASPNPGASR